MSAADLALLDRLPLFQTKMIPDPYSVCWQLREADPAYWSERHKAWLVKGFDQVAAGLNGLRLASDRAQHSAHLAGDVPEIHPFFDWLSNPMVFADPPKHTRLRSLLDKMFTPQLVEGMRPHIQQRVDDLLRPSLATSQFDIVHDLAFPLPATVIAGVLGVPPAVRDKLKAWSDEFVVSFSNHPAEVSTEHYRQALNAMSELAEYFQAAAARIKAEPRDCLLRNLELAEEDEHHLSADELYINANLLLVAGHETKTNLIGDATYELLRHPDQLALLRERPDLIPGAVEEFLPYVGPVQFKNRLAKEDMQPGAKTSRKGEFVFLFLAANRAPAHFQDPERLDVTWPPSKHLAFGVGHQPLPGRSAGSAGSTDRPRHHTNVASRPAPGNREGAVQRQLQDPWPGQVAGRLPADRLSLDPCDQSAAAAAATSAVMFKVE